MSSINVHPLDLVIHEHISTNATFGESSTTVLHHAAGHGMNDLIDSLIGGPKIRCSRCHAGDTPALGSGSGQVRYRLIDCNNM